LAILLLLGQSTLLGRLSLDGLTHQRTAKGADARTDERTCPSLPGRAPDKRSRASPKQCARYGCLFRRSQLPSSTSRRKKHPGDGQQGADAIHLYSHGFDSLATYARPGDIP
jgi:hypothetical protein